MLAFLEARDGFGAMERERPGRPGLACTHASSKRTMGCARLAALSAFSLRDLEGLRLGLSRSKRSRRRSLASMESALTKQKIPCNAVGSGRRKTRMCPCEPLPSAVSVGACPGRFSLPPHLT